MLFFDHFPLLFTQYLNTCCSDAHEKGFRCRTPPSFLIFRQYFIWFYILYLFIHTVPFYMFSAVFFHEFSGHHNLVSTPFTFQAKVCTHAQNFPVKTATRMFFSLILQYRLLQTPYLTLPVLYFFANGPHSNFFVVCLLHLNFLMHSDFHSTRIAPSTSPMGSLITRISMGISETLLLC